MYLMKNHYALKTGQIALVIWKMNDMEESYESSYNKRQKMS